MISVPMVGGGVVPNVGGTYPGDMYAPVTIPTATPYAIPAPSTKQPDQVAYSAHVVPTNAYISPLVAASSSQSLIPAPADCGCGGGSLKWYEVVSAVALIVIAFAAFRKS